MLRIMKPCKYLIMIFLMAILIAADVLGQTREVNFSVDKKIQSGFIDGFGVNINTAWWYKGRYGNPETVFPAIDLAADSLGAVIFRAVIEEIDWEKVNDDGDPDHFNWEYFNTVFEDEKFKGIWEILRYLNKKGVTDRLVISFMGAPPAASPLAKPDPAQSWMGNTLYSIDRDKESELAESLAAFLYYARNRAGISFSLVSPMNETDIVDISIKRPDRKLVVEGPNIPEATQYVRIIRLLARKLDALGMSDVRFVAPDAAGETLFKACLKEMEGDSYLMGKLQYWGVHQYGNDAANYLEILKNSSYPEKPYWVTETAGIKNLFGQLDDNASGFMFWDAYDCVYQHGIRNGYGSAPPNDWVFWEGEQGKPLIGFDSVSYSWKPRKTFYQFAQVFRFVRTGAKRINTVIRDSSVFIHSFLNPDGQLVITGYNAGSAAAELKAALNGLTDVKRMQLYITDNEHDMQKTGRVEITNGNMTFKIPGHAVFTLADITGRDTERIIKEKPEPAGWYAGDMHIHRNCGEVTSLLPESRFTEMMYENDLSVISVLADMGNGEVKDSRTDLPKVTGQDAGLSVPGRIVHWDAEWHYDPAGVTFENKAIGGHLVLLGLKEAKQVWTESPYKILEWGKKQNAVIGFAHMQYLTGKFPSELDCCLPLDFPVETALGTIDFLSEDVWLNDASVGAYYKLLNCGFRPGWAAGTDFPCNGSKPFGSLLTYVNVDDKPLTYDLWIKGIKEGRTVVTTNGHVEFLDLKLDSKYGPGDEIKLKNKGSIDVSVSWTSVIEQLGRIEIICNGKVVHSEDVHAQNGTPVVMNFRLPVAQSSWVCVRRMDKDGHRSHTAPVYVSVKDLPVRASAEDAEYYLNWINDILTRIKDDGPWRTFFRDNIDEVRARYSAAAEIYRTIAEEASKLNRNKKGR